MAKKVYLIWKDPRAPKTEDNWMELNGKEFREFCKTKASRNRYFIRFDSWIDSLREELAKTPEQREKESRCFCEKLAEWEAEALYQELHASDQYCPSSTACDYGPANPWDAPGMSISDFI